MEMFGERFVDMWGLSLDPRYYEVGVFESKKQPKKKPTLAELKLLDGAPDFEVADMIETGLEAVKSVLKDHNAVEKAMYRDRIGWISFEWGTPGREPDMKYLREWQNNRGNVKSAPIYRGGRGISHILAKRDWEGQWIKPLLGQKGMDLVLKLPTLIMRGKVTHPEGHIQVADSRSEVVAILEPANIGNIRNAWVVTGYKAIPWEKYVLK